MIRNELKLTVSIRLIRYTGRHPDKAKPSVRMGGKATGLNNKMAPLTNKTMFWRFELQFLSEEEAIEGGKTA